MRRLTCLLFVALAGCGGPACPEPTTPSASTAEPAVAEARPAPEAEPPQGSVRMIPLDVTGNALMGAFVLRLVDEARTQALPIVIGRAEAHVIDLRMRGERFERPLTHDLLSTMLERLGARVLFVHVDKLESNIFVGSVVLWDGQRLQTFDSRTSDAVAVALGHDAPIYVSEAVIRQAGEALQPQAGPQVAPPQQPQPQP